MLYPACVHLVTLITVVSFITWNSTLIAVVAGSATSAIERVGKYNVTHCKLSFDRRPAQELR